MMDSELKNYSTDFYSLKLSSKQFDKISRLVYQVSGIDLHEGKEELVKARLLKRLRHLKLSDFDRYLKYLLSDKSGTEIRAMVKLSRDFPRVRSGYGVPAAPPARNHIP
jgi:hypothetical protein